MARSEVGLILDLIDRAFDKKAWHGPNIWGCIRRVDFATAAWRPATKRRNIWEIVVHAAYWKYVVRRRLLGEKRGSFPLKGSNWFERPVTLTAKAWAADVALLRESHRAMRAAIAALHDSDLRATPRSSKVSNLQLLGGIAAHDVYHAGQIHLLKRLAAQAKEEKRVIVD
jgi:uncharacterized damage-inducible protein DinB